MKGFRSEDIKDHNITLEDIKPILTVKFNGNYRDKKSYAITGMNCLTQNEMIVDKINRILTICEIDDNLNVHQKVFFEMGIAVKPEGFTLSFGTDQSNDIFKIYEKLFNDLQDSASNVFMDFIDQEHEHNCN